MGFFDRVRKAFDSGGIRTEMRVDKTFRWSDDVLPVDLRFTNTADEPRQVSSVRLQLVEDDRDDPATTRKIRGHYEGRNVFIREAFTLEAGGEHDIHVDFPLSLSGVAGELGAEAPGWLDGLSGVVNAVSELNRETPWYRLRAIPEVDGFTAKKIASRRIRNQRAGEFGGGVFSTTIGGG